MASQLVALCIDAADPDALAGFWSGLLDREVADDPDGGVALLPTGDAGFRIRFVRTGTPKTHPNWMHPDLTSTSLEDQQGRVERALGLGARHLDVGQTAEDGHVVLADPEGNELCVIEPGNAFLAGCGLLGALASDGSQACGYFWAAALGWPLVWDRDEETAIRSPHGGPKITWGGPPLAPKRGKERWHLDLRAEGSLDDEVERLLSLGASRADIGQGAVPWAVLADPDGHELCVRPAREDGGVRP